MTNTQEDRELEVVKSFLVARGMPAGAALIAKRQPPEPDILVRYPDGSCLALEVVQILEQSYAKTWERARATEILRAATRCRARLAARAGVQGADR